MKKRLFLAPLVLLALLFVVACSTSKEVGEVANVPEVCKQAVASGQEPTKVELLSSIYVGWMPNQYADEQSIFAKWGKACNVEFNFRMATDYISSVEAYSAGKIDGVSMTNMEALNFAGTAGVDTTAVVNGDTSNGNDVVITRNNVGLCDLKGREVYLVELSVSHYLLARGLQEQCPNVSEADVKLINTSDSDIGPAFLTNKKQDAVVTWNPIKLEILSQDPSAKNIFDSSQIPGEIIDSWYMRTSLLKNHPEAGVAVAGAWYEVMSIMTAQGPQQEEALSFMAEAAGDNVDSYKEQLTTTNMFWTPASGVAFTNDPQLVKTMDLVRQFSFDHGLFGGAKSVDVVGIEFPDGTVLGDSDNIQIRYTPEYMEAVR